MSPRPRLGGRAAVVVFVLVLFAFTVQSDLTTYLQVSLAFRRPYFLFYVAHSSFALVFPIHLLYLVTTTDRSAKSYFTQLVAVLRTHFSTRPQPQSAFPYRRFINVVVLMLTGITGPGLLWYCSVSMSSISDITALWNTNAFWAYLFAVRFFKLQFQMRHILAVSLASVGVIAIVYGGAPNSKNIAAGNGQTNKSHLFGNLLALVASIWYGFFQVIYKRFVALPDEPDPVVDDAYSRLSITDSIEPEDGDIPLAEDTDVDYSALPFGLFPNLLLSLVGISTIFILAIPFPVLHYLEVEKFAFPTTPSIIFCIAGIASTGLLFNSGFMILLGLWGPIITSVGGLLTIVLVLASDALFVGGLEVLTFWTFAGSFSVIGGFAILALEFYR